MVSSPDGSKRALAQKIMLRAVDNINKLEIGRQISHRSACSEFWSHLKDLSDSISPERRSAKLTHLEVVCIPIQEQKWERKP